MTIGITASLHSPTTNPDRQDVLSEIALKWSKLSNQDLTDITTNDQLVGKIMERYGIKEKAARRAVDILMHGRNLGP